MLTATPIVAGRGKPNADERAAAIELDAHQNAVMTAWVESLGDDSNCPPKCDRCGAELDSEPVPLPPIPGDPMERFSHEAKHDRQWKPTGYHRPVACPVCFPSAAEDAQVAELLARRDRNAHAGRLATQRRRDTWVMTVPPAYRRAGFQNFTADTATRTAAADYLASLTPTTMPSTVVLGGPVGVGKTHLAVAVCRRWLWRHGKNVVWFNDARAADQWRGHYAAGDGDSAGTMIETATYCDLLVLDDLGKARATPGWTSELYAMVNDRIENNRPTLITTNLNSATLIAHWGDTYGEALVSRIGTGRMLAVDGEDFRRGRQKLQS
ncbi:MAG: ATP-binding protein [Planctomycetota bacterium]